MFNLDNTIPVLDSDLEFAEVVVDLGLALTTVPTTDDEALVLWEQSLVQSWPLTQRWQSHIHLVFIASSSVATTFNTRTILVKNWAGLSCGRNLFYAEQALLSHRKFHAMVPELRRLQLSALFSYLGKQGALSNAFNRKKTFSISAVSKRLRIAKYKLTKPLKFRTTRAINFRKNFIKLRKLYFDRLRTSFFFNRIRPQAAKRLLSRFFNKNNLALNLMFNLNPHKLVCRIFPFMDRFFLRNIIRRGELFVNNIQLGLSFNTLKLGDFVRMALSKRFLKAYINWINTQQAYVAIMNKNLHQYYKAQRQRVHKRRKQYLTRFTWYTGFYKAIPTWLEVNFLSLSFFIVKTPAKLAFKSANFNPYLNKLLAFK